MSTYENSRGRFSQDRKKTSSDSSVSENLSDSSTLSEVRDVLYDQYGWMSPYEYYNGSTTSSSLSSYSLNATYTSSTSDSNSSAPDYFWLDSLSNWVYFKYTSERTVVSYTRAKISTTLQIILSVATMGFSNLVIKVLDGESLLSVVKSYLSTYALGLVTYGLAWIPSILTSSSTLKSTYSTASWLDIFSYYIYNLVNGGTYDVDAEYYMETLISSDTFMPRDCISLYMWDGYRRKWLSVAAFADIYDRLGKTISTTDLIEYIEEYILAGWLNSPTEEYITVVGESLGLTEDEISSLYSLIEEYPSDGRSAATVAASIANYIKGTSNFDESVNWIARMAIMSFLGMDPDKFEWLTEKSPLSKLQVVGIDNGSNSSWARYHQLESWTKWIPLPREDKKLKLRVSDTFQLINRPYYFLGTNERDYQGWIHKNYGHPCLFRGNDNLLWICTWNRWTAPRNTTHVKNSTTTRKYKVDSTSDIYEDDIKNWEVILDTVFDVHDDYGYDEWLNSRDGVDYENFSVEEEETTDVTSEVDEDTLNPEKDPLGTGASDTVEPCTITLKFSSRNKVVHDKLEEFIAALRRWK